MTCFMMAVLALAIGPDEPREKPMTDVAQSGNRFAVDLYGRLRDRPGNLFVSPHSIAAALTMAYAGARGETAEQMARVLHLDRPPEDPRLALPSADAGGADRGFRLSVANRLWGQEGCHFLPAYLDLTRTRFGAELARVDFARAEPARREINAWIERQTQGKIKDLIPSGALNALTRLVVTNAIYFKGDWSAPFDKAMTRDDAFHLTARAEVRVPLMHRKARFSFFEGDGLKVLEVPYGRGELAMDIVLPDAVEGLAAVEANLAAETLAGWLASLQPREVDVTLPRFTMTSRFNLAAILKAMGMPRAFASGQADFSGISTEDELVISEVIHQAFVDVNEEGTEAAAATAVVIRARAMARPIPPAVFRADHPFLFLIRDLRAGSILFVGRVANPGG